MTSQSSIQPGSSSVVSRLTATLLRSMSAGRMVGSSKRRASTCPARRSTGTVSASVRSAGVTRTTGRAVLGSRNNAERRQDRARGSVTSGQSIPATLDLPKVSPRTASKARTRSVPGGTDRTAGPSWSPNRSSRRTDIACNSIRPPSAADSKTSQRDHQGAKTDQCFSSRDRHACVTQSRLHWSTNPRASRTASPVAPERTDADSARPGKRPGLSSHRHVERQ